MRVSLFFLLSLALTTPAFAQDTLLLQQRLASTNSVREKIKMIDTVAYLFMLHTDKDSLGEVYGRKALELAQSTNDKELIALALHHNARRSWWDATNKEYRNERFKYYINELLRIAKDSSLREYEAASYHLSGMFDILHYQQADAVRKYQYALLLADEIHNDSLKAEVNNSLGAAYTMSADKVIAFRYFMLALRIAERIGNDITAGNVRMELAKFYAAIGDTAKAVHQLSLSSRHFIKHRERSFEALFWNNIDAANYYRALKNYEAAERSLDEIFTWQGKQHLPLPFITTVHINKYFLLFAQEKFDEAAGYYEGHPEIARLVRTWKINYMPYFIKASQFRKANNFDSSAYYYEHYVIPAVDEVHKSDVARLFEYHFDYGDVLLLNNQPEKARLQFETALELAKKMNLPDIYRNTYEKLHKANAATGKFDAAYRYQTLFHQYSDSVADLGKQREVMQLEVANEAERQLQQQKAEEERIRTRHNLQYMAITVVIATVFAVLMMLGIFTTSASMIRALGFLAVIMLFEFIILIGDNYIHHITHGEPWKVLAIKIAVIAVLFPLHHYVEHKVVKHLISRKKIDLRSVIFGTKKTSKVSVKEEA